MVEYGPQRFGGDDPVMSGRQQVKLSKIWYISIFYYSELDDNKHDKQTTK